MGKSEKKRTLIQILAAVVCNGYAAGFLQGKIYQGDQKFLCVPGLNCYSCPGALGACPIGALQAVLGDRRYKFSYYVFGVLLFFSVVLGRLVCGFLCPFGLVQDLLHKIPLPKWELPRKIDRPLRYLKYVILAVTVVLLPLTLTNAFGIAPPYFCEYLCPVGALEGGIPLASQSESLRQMIGGLFYWKMFLLVLVVIASLVIYRPFCKYLCPLGAFYGLFQRVGFYQMQVDQAKCDGCGRCEKTCPMQVDVRKNINGAECIRCGRCKDICHTSAISSGFRLGPGKTEPKGRRAKEQKIS